MPQPPVSMIAEGTRATYPSAMAAAIAALRAKGMADKKVELGGGVLYDPKANAYTYTNPVGQLDGGHFVARVQVPGGWKLSGLYHDHPAGPESAQFSQDDIETAQKLHVLSYVLSQYDNKIRQFDPASSPVSKSVSGAFSPGSLVDEGQ